MSFAGHDKGFTKEVFSASKPAQLHQGNWTDDSHFVKALTSSWQFQYAQYIGDVAAARYAARLIKQGRMYAHFEPLTLLACIDGQNVGIAALRALDGVHLVTMLEVLEEYRGKAIGAQLLQALCTIRGPVMAHVSIHQPRVKAFYVSQGFHVLQRETVQHDEYLLEFDVVAKR